MLERDRVDNQAVGARAVADRADVGEIGFLRIAQVGNEPTCRLDGCRSSVQAEPLEAMRLQLIEQRASRRLGVYERGTSGTKTRAGPALEGTGLSNSGATQSM